MEIEHYSNCGAKLEQGIKYCQKYDTEVPSFREDDTNSAKQEAKEKPAISTLETINLTGAKYAYINGYFHNWDFILSGLSRIKVIKKPFYGINLVYYYTDRTLQHSEEIFIPANEGMDLEGWRSL